MKSKGLILILIIVTAEFFGCNNSKISEYNDVTNVKIEYSEDNVTEKFDSLFNYSSHIILETRDECLIGRINKILFTDSLIYIMNDNSRLTVFDMSGNYVRTISKVGHGNGEYVKLRDFDIADHILYCLDGKRIHKYRLDGEYIGSVDLENAAQGLCVFPSGISLNNGFGFSSNATKSNHCYSFLDNEGNTMSTLPYNPALTGLTYTVNSQVCKFSKQGSEVLVFFPFNDTIYKIDTNDGMIYPLITAKIGDRNINEDTDSKEIERILNSDEPETIASVYKLNDRVLFNFVDESPKTVLIGLDGKVFVNGIITTDKNKLPVSISEISTTFPNDRIMSIVYPATARKKVSKLEKLGDYPVLEDIYTKTTENSNPVLVLYEPTW